MISGNSEGHYLTRFTYPTDLGGQLKYLVDANMIGVPVEVTEYKNGNIVSGSKTEFTQVNYPISPSLLQTQYEFRRLLHANHHELQSSVWGTYTNR